MKSTCTWKKMVLQNCVYKQEAKALLKLRQNNGQVQEYGNKKDEFARADYVKNFIINVYNVGTFVCPLQPWLSASVDGIVIENEYITKVLEIKCPITCQQILIYDEVNNKMNVPYVQIINDVLELKKSHIYYIVLCRFARSNIFSVEKLYCTEIRMKIFK